MTAFLRVDWSPRAVLALQRRIQFLAKDSPRAANEAYNTIIAAGNRLGEFPNVGRMHRDSRTYRELIVPFGRDGYVILYRPMSDSVRILAIKHMREAGY